MAGEPKPFASLSSGLLARKGAARPAMRPQGFGQLGGALEDLGWNDMGFEPPRPSVIAAVVDNAPEDSATDHPVLHGHAGLTPVDSPVHSQQAQIAGRLSQGDEKAESTDRAVEAREPISEPVAEKVIADPALAELPVRPAPAPRAMRAPRKVPTSRAAPGGKAKAAFTLRLDPSRHLRLRLACAVDGRSAQMIVTDALDRYLDTMPELDAMAARAARKE